MAATSAELATSFVTSFCAARLDDLSSILAEDFRLSGPLFEFDSRSAYIESLAGDLELDPDAEVLSVIGAGSEAAAFYRYRGRLIGQLFKCAEERIYATVLVFDPGHPLP